MERELEFVWEFKGQIIHLYEHEIYYVHLQERNTFVHTRSRSYAIGHKINEEEEFLKGIPIVRIHYSYLVHMVHMEAVGQSEVILRNGVHLPVSENRSKEVREMVRAYFYNVRKCKNRG